MTETRHISERYAEIGTDIIETEDALAHIRDSEATIIYLGSDKAKTSRGRTVFGECERVADKNRWAIPADFLIVVYEPNCAEMGDEQMRVLLLHELLHVGVDHDKDGNEVYRVVPHDLEDFMLIVDRYGTGWAQS